jgi:hypothetical protein
MFEEEYNILALKRMHLYRKQARVLVAHLHRRGFPKLPNLRFLDLHHNEQGDNEADEDDQDDPAA